MLKVDQLSLSLPGFYLEEISFEAPPGSYCVLLGASGAGKTLLLEAIAGIRSLKQGLITLKEQAIHTLPAHRRPLSLVYQDQALFPHLSVSGNLGYGLKRKLGPTMRKEKINAIADRFGLSALLSRYPDSLSGGEAQRVALARAIMTDPDILLLDEPISSLDRPARQQISALLRDLHRKGQTIIHVTHDYQEAFSLATHVGVIEKHRLVQWGSPQEIFHHPKSAFVASFVGIRNFFSGRFHAGAPGRLSQFNCHGLLFESLAKSRASLGHITFPSDAVSLHAKRPAEKMRNLFLGAVTDLIPMESGIEVLVDVGVEIGALVSLEEKEILKLRCGQSIWLSIKAESIQFME